MPTYRIGRVEVRVTPGPLDTPCHVWMGCVNRSGHTLRLVDGRCVIEHRAIYREAKGPIAAGHEIHHRCQNKRCVNPDHLEAHTLLEHRALHRTFSYEEAVELRALGMTYRAIGQSLGVTTTAVKAAFGRMQLRGGVPIKDLTKVAAR